MKKVRKVRGILSVILSVMLAAGLFSGCSKSDIDPVKTVQAVLDAELKGEIDALVELTGEEKEDVQEQYDELMDQFAKGLVAEMSLFDASVVDDAAMKDLSKKILSSAKYEVKEAEKDDKGNYTVNVAVSPSNLVENAMQSAIQQVMQAPPADMAKIADIVMTAFDEALASQTYGEAQTLQVRLTKDDDNQYEVNEEDLEAVGAALFSMPEELVVASGKDYGNTYLNWLKEDWDAASDDEKMKCCLAMVQKMVGFSDEEMALINPADPTVQQGVADMKTGIQELYESGVNMSIGDFTEYMMSLGMTY